MTADPSRIQVVTPLLLAHVQAVEGVVDRMLRGQDAVRQVRLGGGEYGQLCWALPMMLEPLHDLVDQVLAETRAALQDTVLSLRTAVESYDGTDGAVATRLGSASIRLPL